MKRFSAVLFILLLVSFAHAQQRWEKTYGGLNADYSFSVQQTQDGCYIVAGGTFSFGNPCQVYLIKTNASGDTLWTKIYGGANGEFAYSVKQTSDEGYIIAGYYADTSSNLSGYLMKTNASGDSLWGGWRTPYSAYSSVQQTQEGGYIIAGYTEAFGDSYQVYLIKTNASGLYLWERAYGGTGNDVGQSVQQTTDGCYIVAGQTNSYGNSYQVYLIKTNANGDTIWTRTYGGTGDDYGRSVWLTSDSGYIVAGKTNSFGNADQVYLIKTNGNGDTLWTRTYGGTSSDWGFSVQQTRDGGYIVAGNTWSFGNVSQVYLIKTNASGDTLWTKNYGGTDNDYGTSVQQTSDGGYIVAGYTWSFGNEWQVYLIKTDANGNVGVESKAVSSPVSRLPLSVSPNPFTSFATVPGRSTERFALYDVSGRRVGTYRGDRIGEGLVPGVYFLRAEKGDRKPLRVVKVR